MGRRMLVRRYGATKHEIIDRKIDIDIGTFVSNLVTYFIILTAAVTLHQRGLTEDEASATIVNAVGRWYEFDLTSYLKAQKAAGKTLVTLVLRNPVTAKPATEFNSRGATTNRPQLVIT